MHAPATAQSRLLCSSSALAECVCRSLLCCVLVSAVVSVLRTATPAQCPDCMSFDSMERLPQVLSKHRFMECTLEDGNMDDQRLANFYCTSCKRAMFSSCQCERFGSAVMPLGVLEPRIVSEQDAILWLIVLGGYWPATPTKTRTVFRVCAIDLRNAFKFQYVSLLAWVFTSLLFAELPAPVSGPSLRRLMM